MNEAELERLTLQVLCALDVITMFLDAGGLHAYIAMPVRFPQSHNFMLTYLFTRLYLKL